MYRTKKAAWSLAVCGALLVPAGAGCGSSAGAVPSGKEARSALEAALTAWTRGVKPGEVTGTEPPVVVHDTTWARGRRLGSFEILREEEGAAAEKQFTVRLAMTKPDRTEEVKYHVLGVGPMMVFSDEDYRRNINMENGPSLTKPSRPGRTPK